MYTLRYIQSHKVFNKILHECFVDDAKTEKTFYTVPLNSYLIQGFTQSLVDGLVGLIMHVKTLVKPAHSNK